MSRNNVKRLNEMTPVTQDVGLGDLLQSLITAFNALLVKLDAESLAASDYVSTLNMPSIDGNVFTSLSGGNIDIATAITGVLAIANGGTGKTTNTFTLNTVSGTSATLAAGDSGKLVVTTSGSATTLTVTDGLAAGWYCFVLQKGAGAASVARQTSDTINGSTSAVAVGGAHKLAFVVRDTTGNTEVIAL